MKEYDASRVLPPQAFRDLGIAGGPFRLETRDMEVALCTEKYISFERKRSVAGRRWVSSRLRNGSLSAFV
jgi:hypothetical protein